MGISRARAYAAIDRALERSRSASRDRERGQATMFGIFEQSASRANGNGHKVATAMDDYPPAGEWDKIELLKREREALGCYVSGHPLFRYQSKLGRLGVVFSTKVSSEEPWSMVAVAGIVENYQEKIFKSGSGRAAFLEIEDMYGRVKAKVRGDRIDTYSHLLTSGDPVLLTGKVSFPMTEEPDEEREATLLVDSVELLSDAALKATRSVTIKLDADRTARRDFEALKVLILASPGPCPVELVLSLGEGTEAVLDLEGTRVTPNDVFLGGLERMFGTTVAELR
jgi:DNA polymerase-3 subunit alpha